MIVRALEQLPIRNGVWWDIQPRQVSRLVGLHLRSVGVDANAHQLRHFAGTSWCRESGHDLLATAALMRHRNVATTMIYAQLDPSRGAEVVHSVGLAGLQPQPPAPPASPTVPARPALRLVRDEAG